MVSFTGELRSVVSAIREDRPTSVGGNDGRVLVVMAMAPCRSYEERRSVRLKEIEA